MPRSLPPSSRTSASTSNPALPASFARSVKSEIITWRSSTTPTASAARCPPPTSLRPSTASSKSCGATAAATSIPKTPSSSSSVLPSPNSKPDAGAASPPPSKPPSISSTPSFSHDSRAKNESLRHKILDKCHPVRGPRPALRAPLPQLYSRDPQKAGSLPGLPQLPRRHPPLAVHHPCRRGPQRPARNDAPPQRRFLPLGTDPEVEAGLSRLPARNWTLAPRRLLRPECPRSVQRPLSVQIRERGLPMPSDTTFLTSAPGSTGCATAPASPSSNSRRAASLRPNSTATAAASRLATAPPPSPPATAPPTAASPYPPPSTNSAPSTNSFTTSTTTPPAPNGLTATKAAPIPKASSASSTVKILPPPGAASSTTSGSSASKPPPQPMTPRPPKSSPSSPQNARPSTKKRRSSSASSRWNSTRRTIPWIR